MEISDRHIPIIYILVLVFLVIETVFMISEHLSIEERKKAGNERWIEVEERIKEIEENCGCGTNS